MPYIPPTTQLSTLTPQQLLCASGSTTVTFGVRVDNTEPAEIIF